MLTAYQYLQLIKEALKPSYSNYVIERDVTGKIVKLVINNSLLSDLFFTSNQYDKNALSDYCPKKLKAIHMDGQRMVINKYMLRGLYFESKIFGTADGKDYDLPLTARGKRSVIQDRIDEQIKMFPQLAEKLGVIYGPKNTQIEKIIQIENWGDVEVFIKGKFDIITPLESPEGYFDAVVVDTKLTSDLEGGYWSKYVDTTQAQLYSLMTGLPFYYWIFDYTPHMRNSLRRVITKTYHKPGEEHEATMRDVELKAKIKEAIKLIMTHEVDGYPENPNQRECVSCPLNPEHGGNCLQSIQSNVM